MISTKTTSDILNERKKSSYIIWGASVFAVFFIYLIYGMMPADIGSIEEKTVLIKRGFGVSDIADVLQKENLLRSPTVFKVITLLRGDRANLKPGLYKLRASYSAYGLVRVLVKGGVDEVEVLVPEGATLKEIDKILSDSGVISPNELTEYREDLEGFLFPDTYKFHIDSEPKDVVQKFLDNFDEKVSGLLGLGAKNNLISDTKNSNAYKTIILASLLEKELTDFKERRIVSGILQKRIKSGWPLQVDATICYVVPMPCHPITPLDLKIDSPYNTYINKGLPPTPIANPGLEAIRAAINPQQSSYWFYLSDPKTGKTIFSKDLEEHSLNRALYLR